MKSLIGPSAERKGEKAFFSLSTYQVLAAGTLLCGAVTYWGTAGVMTAFAFASGDHVVTALAENVLGTPPSQTVLGSVPAGTAGTVIEGGRSDGSGGTSAFVFFAGGSGLSGWVPENTLQLTQGGGNSTPSSSSTDTGGLIPGASSFAPFMVGSTTVQLGTPTVMNPGTYSVSENTNPDFAATFSNDCPGGTVTLNPGDIKTCTITNTDQRAVITVNKVIVSDVNPVATSTPNPGLNIYKVTTYALTTNSVHVAWVTNTPATSQALYNTSSTMTASATQVIQSTDMVTNHDETLINLAPSTKYFYFVISSDSAGNTAVSPVFSFVTPGIGSPSASAADPAGALATATAIPTQNSSGSSDSTTNEISLATMGALAAAGIKRIFT
ncbi:MAG TPA: fibronectin type III domain-containing protein [Candidatus Paceibacterota bacterium]|nr:fibronectin type III domain-containing protein [Candidatus Paceibacterota bacterium]